MSKDVIPPQPARPVTVAAPAQTNGTGAPPQQRPPLVKVKKGIGFATVIWLVVGLAVLGAAGWFGYQHFFAPKPQAQARTRRPRRPAPAMACTTAPTPASPTRCASCRPRRPRGTSASTSSASARSCPTTPSPSRRA
ncbi:MAG: hypothetical protein WDO13_13020 [Verrucomicrobiota bacterium]